MKFKIKFFRTRKFEDNSVLYFASVVEEESQAEFFISLKYFEKNIYGIYDIDELEIRFNELFGINRRGEEIRSDFLVENLTGDDLYKLIGEIASKLNITADSVENVRKIFRHICLNLIEYFPKIKEYIEKEKAKRERLLKRFEELYKKMVEEDEI